MKTKYVMIRGLAFSEESDMKTLSDYAKQGWILQGISGGFLYKLKKDTPQDLVYSLDYQINADEEYFTIFKEAGWQKVVSVENQMHIFSAQAGTKPIYSDGQSEIDKYISVRNTTKRGTIYSLIAGIVIIALLALSLFAARPIFLILFGFLIIDMIIFTFNFMPYLAYNSRIKQIKKYGKLNDMDDKKRLGKINLFIGITFTVLGILYLNESKYSAIIFILLGIINIFASINSYKKYKKSL
ncbi:DUF2812 domain-containing protein [Clostridium sp. YIM B02515]|uniref:DUF2812 domain-containing protein n=1 Tax=Clostridium rhizosphaerae TaxID=2803861 RepID=A0ABS1TA19_9CLOT|nr:DUF2812 domain-containing protein [Clostridium rhizosphaerae]MBL4935602.1 DUF2812 domain-containing protein [Clostridium rhizosphaerae]